LISFVGYGNIGPGYGDIKLIPCKSTIYKGFFFLGSHWVATDDITMVFFMKLIETVRRDG
jgi:hypothetical protein